MASFGNTLKVVPDSKWQIVKTKSFLLQMLRDWIVCSCWYTALAAAMGSVSLWGVEPWPP